MPFAAAKARGIRLASNGRNSEVAHPISRPDSETL